MIINDDARRAFENEDWQIVKEYIEFLEKKEDRLGLMEESLNKMESDGHKEILTKYFSKVKVK